MQRSSVKMNSLCSSVRWAFNTASWVPTDDQILIATSCIQQEEKTRIGRFVFQKDAKASLIGRLLMRKFVADYSNRNYSSVYFDRDVKGKPFLVDICQEHEKLELDFNVSHQGNFAVLAGEVGKKKVGVDVMKIEYTGGKSLSEFFRLMTRHFSPEEWVTINGSYGTKDRKKLEMFYRHWCLKESYVKATGTGITVNLQRISFKINTYDLAVGLVTKDTKLYVDGKEQTEWCFEETLLDNEHCVAVAVTSSDNSLYRPSDNNHFEFLDFSDLMQGCEPLLTPDPLFTSNFLKKEERP
ncbi:L-aminoadipate-semialdehyde dehydrogenase-phosphopantetheinyl transferase [Anabrus simplex]|uniref:L-aminoadipate-semialdehyde dehydrogenase-phosphopantetheinyl transferase n=1 Tax=Anabrus simplex TaxID=316456 RepID=UPI0035A35B89